MGALLALVLACGAERWDAKVSTDACSATPATATVESLSQLPVPFAKWSNTLARTSAENQVFSVTADLVGFKLEADRDWHIVIRGDSGTTMVVEMPDPLCAPDADRAAKYRDARNRFLRYAREPRAGKLQRVKAPIRLTFVGPLFFDKIHGQDGVARNGVELHPVTIGTCP